MSSASQSARLRVAILGFGLIGGSVARALRAARNRGFDRPEVVAWSPGGRGPLAALAAGVIDAVAYDPAAAIADADLVVLAAPPLASLELLDSLGGGLREVLRPEATITDVVSTKARICARAVALGLPFVGGHPMAGRETTGFGAASDDLFVDRPWVVAPSAGRVRDLDRVEWLARACGARPIRMEAEEHDAATAAISHVPLVVAAALVEAMAGRDGEAPGWPLAASLAAGGWASATRVAKGDPVMGAGILTTNAAPVAERLRRLGAALGEWATILDAAPDDGTRAAALEARLRAARERLG